MSDPRQAGGPAPDGHQEPPTAVQPPARPPARESEIDLLTLVIAACASAAAAFLTSLVWARGALASAAATPVIVAIVKEALRRPSTVVTQVSPKLPPNVHRKVRHHWRLALLTGLAGFAIFAAIVTIPELIAGSSLLRGNERTTLFSGSQPARRSAPPKDSTTKSAPQRTVTVTTVTVVTTPTPTEHQTTPVTPTTPQQTTPTQPQTTVQTQPPATPAPADTTAGGTAGATP